MARKKILDNILEAVGNTPIVRLNNITKGINATVLAKLEFFNPGGSVKDRIGIAMIEAAEREGLIKPGYTIVEPTSGNTGVGLALAALLKGYKVIFTVPDKVSTEKINLLKALGAKVIVTPTSVPPDHPNSYTKVAEKIVKSEPNSFMPNQYFNPANPEIHYRTTGPEIWEQTDGKIDVLVAGIGTGGTISGVGKYLKEMNPNIKVIGADPEGSLYHHSFYNTQGEIHTYKVEGIGEDFFPSTYNPKVIDDIVVVSDKDAFLTARRLAREEGIFAGGSSGAAVFAALEVAKKLEKDKVIVVILPDTGRNYLTKLYSDEWMIENGFIDSEVIEVSVEDILNSKKSRIKELIYVKPSDKVTHAMNLMIKYNISQLPVIDGEFQVGSVSEKGLIDKMYNMYSLDNLYFEDINVGQVMDPPFKTVDKKDKIRNPFLLFKEENAIIVLENKKIIDIITVIDVVKYFMNK
ncbi:MAG: cystathionine beta-synthase [Brevinematia bacterium]